MNRPDYLVSGELTRLIPAAKKAESRNTSAIGAILMGVEEFDEALLGPFGAPTGKRARTEVWLEPVFKSSRKNKTDRPDALIIVSNGRREWRALMEVKIKGNELEPEQIERYLDVAKNEQIDAVITLSNQFVATPSQSPCDISSQKLKKVSLYHWSWGYLKTEAKIELAKKAVHDPDQVYMLKEFVRYLEHESAGVREFDRMGKEWVEACNIYFAKSRLDKNSPLATKVVADWDELTRCTALRLSRELETNVTTVLSSSERKNPEARLTKLQSSFIKQGVLKNRLDVPDAASPLELEADLASRSITVSMSVGAPRDKKRASACVNWLLRQLKHNNDGHIMLFAKWPGRTIDTCATLARVKEDVELLVGERKGQLPHTFELRLISDLGGKFTQNKNFVVEAGNCVRHFYETVGQYIIPWQAPPPKPKKPRKDMAAMNSEQPQQGIQDNTSLSSYDNKPTVQQNLTTLNSDN